MKVIVQKVLSASCKVNNEITGSIDKGFMLLVGFTEGDNREKLLKMAKKIANLRIFEDENGKMNLSILDVGGSILSISQFTLYADPYSGNRPSFVNALRGDLSKPLYLEFNRILRDEYHLVVEEGIFGEHMIINPICDGPVTINIEY